MRLLGPRPWANRRSTRQRKHGSRLKCYHRVPTYLVGTETSDGKMIFKVQRKDKTHISIQWLHLRRAAWMWESLQAASGAVVTLKVEDGVAVVALLLPCIVYVHVMRSFCASHYI